MTTAWIIYGVFGIFLGIGGFIVHGVIRHIQNHPQDENNK